MLFKNIKGQVFGNWLVLERAENRLCNKQVMWHCECQCGSKVKKEISGSVLRLGQSRGCKKCKSNYKRLRPYEAL